MPDAQPRAADVVRRTYATAIQQRPRALPDLEQRRPAGVALAIGPQSSPRRPSCAWRGRHVREGLELQGAEGIHGAGTAADPSSARVKIGAAPCRDPSDRPPLCPRPSAARSSSQSIPTPTKPARRHFLRRRRLARRFHRPPSRRLTARAGDDPSRRHRETRRPDRRRRLLDTQGSACAATRLLNPGRGRSGSKPSSWKCRSPRTSAA